MSEEKRKSTRIESDQFISFKVYDGQNRVCNEGMALAKDISKTGVLLENRLGFDVGASVDLAIALTEEILNKHAKPNIYRLGGARFSNLKG